ncbi:MAG TPA: helix-turn-helix transcriptional regulator [Casimicrobiaceae bacterium]|jgi:transcriptional regulator with XRE-family HTH domain
MNDLSDDLRKEFLDDKEYAHAYMESYVDAYIATQIKVIREQREWSQEQLANETGMKQARISVLENVDYSSWSVSTLRRFARAFDLVLRVTFEEFGTEIGRMSEFGANGLRRTGRSEDLSRAAKAEAIQPATGTSGQTVSLPGTSKERVYRADATPDEVIVIPPLQPNRSVVHAS